MKKKLNSDYLRNILFGAEDSLVSTVGVTFGLSVSGKYSPSQLLLAGLVLVAVEAISMGVGSYLSEEEVHESDGKKTHRDSPILDGILMFFSYLFFGGMVLTPYVVFHPDISKYISVGVTLFLLFMIGYLPTQKVKNGLRMFITAGLAVAIGFFVSTIF